MIQCLAGFPRVVAAGLGEIILERAGGGLRSTTDILAPDDPVVVSRRDPLLQLAGPHRMHRMGQRQRVQDLVDHIEALVALRVFLGLRHEGLEVELSHHVGRPHPAGHLHEQPLRRERILTAQEAGPVAGQLRFPHPFQQGQPDWQEGDSRQDRQRGEAHQQQDLGDGAIERVAAHDMPHLMRDEGPHFVVVQHLQRC